MAARNGGSNPSNVPKLTPARSESQVVAEICWMHRSQPQPLNTKEITCGNECPTAPYDHASTPPVPCCAWPIEFCPSIILFRLKLRDTISGFSLCR